MDKLRETFWIWAEFSQNDSINLIDLKNTVQQFLRSPFFDLHLTLAGPFNTFTQNQIKEIGLLCKENNSFKVQSKGYEYKNQFYESFYISIENSHKLIDLRKKIAHIKQFNINKTFNPHISLSYGNHENSLKEHLLTILPSPYNILNVDKLSIVHVNEYENIWDIIYTFNFNNL